ncbi:MAG: GNAT family N-acetyltransferase [Prevotellaceae bacterium]|jgi:predicted GNAT family N-acyltransferase|nr:GNAT family N-acetyltransferase [Prevotellaceae bacterium]
MSTQTLKAPANIKLARLGEDTIVPPFECGDNDLNDFLMNDAKNYSKSLLAVTYLLQADDEIVAYFSLSNDRLIKNDRERPVWNRINRIIPNDKRRRSYPAVKIGRLAVAKKYAGKRLGSYIILAIQNMYINEPQRAGCRFLMVDAYKNALPFYQKNDFKFLTEQDYNDDTRIMYFDLKAILA